MKDELNEPMLGDGTYPKRLLRNSEDQRRWIATHNPYIPGSIESEVWVALFYNDQISALRDPRRSRVAWLDRYILIPLQLVVALIMVAVFTILIVQDLK